MVKIKKVLLSVSTKIKIGILISYDYIYCLTCIKQVYEYADEIYLALDSNRVTWSGNSFDFDEKFLDKIKELDKDCKITIYEDNFYIPSNSSMQNETNERNMLAKKMGDGWCIQIDADEYVYNFDKFVEYLAELKVFQNRLKKTISLVLYGHMVTLFKKLDNGYLYIENNENIAFCTNSPNYIYARQQDANIKFQTNFMIIHESWSRSEEEILQKITNWGHKTDFDTAAFYEFWKNINSQNYHDVTNFHPMDGITWDKLHFLECNSIDEFIEKYQENNPQKLASPNKLIWKGRRRYLKSFFK